MIVAAGMSMLPEDRLSHALDLQARSYALLQWMAEAVRKGFIAFHTAHDYGTLPSAAEGWIRRHFDDLPVVARPEPDAIGDFARFFTTYLQGTFDLVSDPGKRLHSPDAHCFCPMCSWLIDAPNLRPRKSSAADRHRADRLEVAALRALAFDAGAMLDDDALLAFKAAPELREDIALFAYGRDLVESRLRGEIDGAAPLVLWRRFAWTRKGSPKKGFRLTAERILRSEHVLRERLLAQSREQENPPGS